MTLETADLVAVVTLADELHFGRAAERLHVSQPALSKQIQRVEAKVGGPLFVRGYRDVQATEAGRLLAADARHVLQASQNALDLARRAARGEAGLLRVGFGIATIFDLLPDVLLRFRRAHPDVEVRLQDMSTPSQLAALASGDIDVGFVRLPVTDPTIAVRAVLRDRLVAAMPPATRWHAALGLRSLAGQPFVVCARSSSASYYDHVVSVCRAAGFAPSIVQETDELYTVLALVRAGIGVALVPAAARGMRLGGIRFREVGLPHAQWDIGVAWRRDRAAGPLIDRFVNFAAAYRARARSDRTVAGRI
jgi:DNA-binding transcriptional LysR family regulator